RLLRPDADDALGREEQLVGATEHVGGAVHLEHRAERRVRVGRDALGRELPDPDRAVLGERPVAVLALAEGLLGAEAPGEVVADDEARAAAAELDRPAGERGQLDPGNVARREAEELGARA